jgi:hypothetical protein
MESRYPVIVQEGEPDRLRPYRVLTPEYGVVIPVTDEGQGPLEYGRDLVGVRAESATDAKLLGVAYLRHKGGYYDHCNGNPYTGVVVERCDCRHGRAEWDGCDECERECEEF